MKEKVFLTGGTGFIGSHLVPELIKRGYEVYVLERQTSTRYIELKNARVVYGDLRDFYAIKYWIDRISPDYVIHLGAITPVAYSYNHPQEVMEVNLIGTVNLAQACLLKESIKQFLFASTSEVYGNNGHNVQKEENPLRPESPYAVSKVACENYLMYLYRAYRFPVTILRPFNTYGRKRSVHFLIERTIYQMLTGDKVLLGDPKKIRDWLYVEDHVNAYLTCLGKEETIGEVFNFCTGKGYTIEQTVNLIAELIGFKGDILWYRTPLRPIESDIIIGDYTKAFMKLGWSPKYSLEEGLKKTIEYWRKRVKSWG